MEALIKYLSNILIAKGHFHIVDELEYANIKRLESSITAFLKMLPNDDLSYFEKDDIESKVYSVQSLDRNLFEALNEQYQALEGLRDFWRILDEGNQELRRKTTLRSKSIEIFRLYIYERLRFHHSNININSELHICYLEDGRVSFAEDFIDVVQIIETLSSKPNLLFFRGHSNSSYRLLPSIYRGTAPFYEREVLYDTINLLPEEVQDANSTFEILTKLQHFGAPTRLLDLSTNPLVALFFACSNHQNNGEVICFEVEKSQVKLFDSDTVSMLSNLAKMEWGFDIRPLDKTALVKFNAEEIVRELVHKIRNEKPYFDNVIKHQDLGRSFFITPKLDNPRLIRQSGAFIISGIEGAKYSPSNEIFSIERNARKRIIISQKLKNQIIKSLDTFNISSGSMFPDLSEVSRYIKSKYGIK